MFWAIGLLSLALIAICISLQNKKIQTLIAQAATIELSEYIGSEVSIGSIEYQFFNHIVLTDVCIHDLNHHEMVGFKRLDAHFDFWRFFQKEFIVKRLELDSASIRLEYDTAGIANYAFLAPFFQSNSKELNLLLCLDDIYLSDCRFRFSDKRFAHASISHFDPHNLDISHIDAHLSLHHFSKDSIHASIKHLSGMEQCGLSIENISTQLQANKSHATISHLALQMPHSQIQTDSIQLCYKDIRSGDYSNVLIQMPLRQCCIGLEDISMLHPSVQHLHGVVELQLNIDGYLSDLHIQKIALDYNHHSVLRGYVDFIGLPNLRTSKFYAGIQELSVSPNILQDFLSDLQGRPFSLPPQIDHLGKVKYKGHLSGVYDQLVANGSLQTQLGNLSIDMRLSAIKDFTFLRFNGSVGTNRFHIGRLLGDKSLGNISFRISGDVQQDDLHPLHGTIKGDVDLLEFNNYSYTAIHADGYFNPKSFNGKLTIDDPHLSTQFNGLIDRTQALPEYKFDFNLEKANLHALQFTEKYHDSHLQGKLSVNMKGNSLDDLNGYILLDSLLFQNGDKSFLLDNLNISSTTSPSSSQVLIQSDIIKAHFTGAYKYSTLPITLQRLIYEQLPSLFNVEQKRQLRESTVQNTIDFSVQINDTYDLTQALDLPIRLADVSMIKGSISDKDNTFDLRVGIPKIIVGKLHFNDISILFDNDQGHPAFAAYLQQGKRKNKSTIFQANVDAKQDSITASINWFNHDSIVNKGDISSLIVLASENDFPTANIQIQPSSIILQDSLWHLSSGPIMWRQDTTLFIDNFILSNHSQHIYINGVMGRSLSDSVKVDLKQINLGYIIDMIPTLGDVSFGGEATGNAYLYSVLHKPMFEANVFLRDGNVNNAPIGDVNANAIWDKDNQEIALRGVAISAADTVALIDGYIAPARDSIELFFDANGVSLSFINRYMSEFAEDVSGWAYGDVRMYGTLNTPNDVHFEGQAFVDKGSMKIPMLGTYFHFSDSIYLTEKTVQLPNIPVTDVLGNRGLLDGEVTHDGAFKDLHYRIRISCENLLAMNTLISDNDFFFGNVYATGNVLITGDEKESQINVNARTCPKTEFNISLASASVASDNSFVTFVQHQKEEDKEEEEEDIVTTSTAHVKLRLNIEVTPEATLQVIIDPKTGDLLTARGQGNLVVEYDSNSEDVRMMGTYTIESGSYQFTLQNVFRKEFQIAQGSSLTWAGDPLNAQMNIKALYSLTASLRDLMNQSEIEATTKRSSVPVNCILYLTDDLMSPSIRFDIELPNSDEALKQQVRNIINTDEMMNRQILYLLIFNKFYTPEYLQTSTINIGSNEAYSLLSSTVTGQINNWISKLTDSFTFGFNVRAHGVGETATQEYETAILYQPNNRLIVNGNFGYRNDNLATNKFIGDVDVEYLLSQNGKFRVKAYTHTVDKYTLKTAQTMQGVGLIYKEEFNNAQELIHSFKDLFTSKKKKGDKKSNKKNKKKQDQASSSVPTDSIQVPKAVLPTDTLLQEVQPVNSDTIP